MPSLLKNLLFPPVCAGCGVRIAVADWRRGDVCLCRDCRARWELSKLASCARCGEAQLDCRCLTPLLRAAGMTTLVALSRYGVRTEDGTTAVTDSMLLSLKDRHIGGCEHFLAEQLAHGVRRTLEEVGWSSAQTVISYCPRRADKVRQSGTDQARRLAQALARQLGLPCRPLLRHVGQGEQKRLDARARAAHAQAAYVLRRHAHVAACRVVLVDDIVTTGASMAACCERLLEAGACGVMGVAVARTQGK